MIHSVSSSDSGDISEISGGSLHTSPATTHGMSQIAAEHSFSNSTYPFSPSAYDAI